MKKPAPQKREAGRIDLRESLDQSFLTVEALLGMCIMQTYMMVIATAMVSP